MVNPSMATNPGGVSYVEPKRIYLFGLRLSPILLGLQYPSRSLLPAVVLHPHYSIALPTTLQGSLWIFANCLLQSDGA